MTNKEIKEKLQGGETLVNGKKQFGYNENTMKYIVTGGDKLCNTIDINKAINYFKL